MKSAFQSVLTMTAVSAFLVVLAPAAHGADAEAAKALARQNKCLNCHAVEKEKEGPSYKKVAEKYRGKPDAEASILKHISLGKKVKFPDGHEEEHKIVKTTPADDNDQIKNLIAWILEQ